MYLGVAKRFIFLVCKIKIINIEDWCIKVKYIWDCNRFFFIKDKKWISYFFKQTFLLAYNKMDIVLKVLFIIWSNIKIYFSIWHLYLITYIITKAFLTKTWVELIKKKEFVVSALDFRDNVIIIYISFISQNSDLYLSLIA